MHKKISKILFIFLLIISTIFLVNCSKSFNEVSINNGKEIIKIKVEIADDNRERENGLMNREKLDENSGMLFVFDEENFQSFWMKNTLIPLDIIFIDENLKIVDVNHGVPCKIEDCEIYSSGKPARYVLEANAKFTLKNGIGIGDDVLISLVK